MSEATRLQAGHTLISDLLLRLVVSVALRSLHGQSRLRAIRHPYLRIQAFYSCSLLGHTIVCTMYQCQFNRISHGVFCFCSASGPAREVETIDNHWLNLPLAHGNSATSTPGLTTVPQHLSAPCLLNATECLFSTVLTSILMGSTSQICVRLAWRPQVCMCPKVKSAPGQD